MFNLGFDKYPEGGQLSLLFRMKETFYEEVKVKFRELPGII